RGHADTEDDLRQGKIRARFAAQLSCCADGPQRVILAGDREPEHRGDTLVIGVVDDAAVSLDRSTDDLLGTSPERLEDLRVDAVAGRDRAGVENGDHPAPALRPRLPPPPPPTGGGAAARAPP